MKIVSKRKQKRFRVYWRHFMNSLNSQFSQKDELNDIQLTSISIARRLICNQESKLNYAPISSTCYIENGHYLIRLADNALSIKNGKFSYFVWLPSKNIDDIRSLFYRVLEGRKEAIDKMYDKTTLENLKGIADSLKLDK